MFCRLLGILFFKKKNHWIHKLILFMFIQKTQINREAFSNWFLYKLLNFPGFIDIPGWNCLFCIAGKCTCPSVSINISAFHMIENLNKALRKGSALKICVWWWVVVGCFFLHACWGILMCSIVSGSFGIYCFIRIQWESAALAGITSSSPSKISYAEMRDCCIHIPPPDVCESSPKLL